jgi:hypothetical protein
MNHYLVKTPTLIVDRVPYALIDRVAVQAESPDQARSLAVAVLRERGSEWIFACMIEGVDPCDELIVIEHRMAFDPEVVSVTDPAAFDIHAAAKASRLAESLRHARKELTLWKAGAVALVVLLIGVMFAANYALGLKSENDKSENTTMETPNAKL